MTETSRGLWSAYQADRSIENRNRLVEHYMDFAVRVSARLATSHSCSVETEDMEGVAFVALIRAVEKYDSRRSRRFKSFANVCIRNEIFNESRREYRWRRNRRLSAACEEASGGTESVDENDEVECLVGMFPKRAALTARDIVRIRENYQRRQRRELERES